MDLTSFTAVTSTMDCQQKLYVGKQARSKPALWTGILYGLDTSAPCSLQSSQNTVLNITKLIKYLCGAGGCHTQSPYALFRFVTASAVSVLSASLFTMLNLQYWVCLSLDNAQFYICRVLNTQSSHS